MLNAIHNGTKCKLDCMFKIVETRREKIVIYKAIAQHIYITYIKNIRRMPPNGCHRICKFAREQKKM